jgi:hypothetical protein
VPVLVRVIEDAREGGGGADDGGADEGKKEGEGIKAPLKDEEVSFYLVSSAEQIRIHSKAHSCSTPEVSTMS